MGRTSSCAAGVGGRANGCIDYTTSDNANLQATQLTLDAVRAEIAQLADQVLRKIRYPTSDVRFWSDQVKTNPY